MKDATFQLHPSSFFHHKYNFHTEIATKYKYIYIYRHINFSIPFYIYKLQYFASVVVLQTSHVKRFPGTVFARRSSFFVTSSFVSIIFKRLKVSAEDIPSPSILFCCFSQGQFIKNKIRGPFQSSVACD